DADDARPPRRVATGPVAPGERPALSRLSPAGGRRRAVTALEVEELRAVAGLSRHDRRPRVRASAGRRACPGRALAVPRYARGRARGPAGAGSGRPRLAAAARCALATPGPIAPAQNAAGGLLQTRWGTDRRRPAPEPAVARGFSHPAR